MGIISRADKKKRGFISVKAKFLLSYVVILAMVLTLLNTYPIILSRDLVFRAKQETLSARANQISISVGSLDSMTQKNVFGVMQLMDTSSLGRITIVNADNEVLFQEISRNVRVNEIDPRPIMTDALNGNDSFRSIFSSGAFLSGVGVPVFSGGKIAGCVYIFEYDENVGSIVTGLRNDIGIISVVLSITTLILGFIFSGTITRRIRMVLNAIKTVREGEYTYRINVEGHDELAGLADEFNSLTKRLQSTEETRRRFVADASHDLKTPLASIRLLSDSILQTENMDNDTLREFVEDIRNESERLASTTGQLLDLTKLDNDIATVREPTAVTPVLENAVRMLKPIADAKDIELSVESSSREMTVLASEDDLFKIISNLTDNAVKYTNPGGTVKISAQKIDASVVITVSDTGIGIPEQDIPYIFDRFYRVDKSRSREQGGSGLGLSIVKSTVEKHSGKVEAIKNGAGGMDFCVTFPLYSF